MKKLLACGAAVAALMGTTAAHAAIGPAVGNNPSANLIIDLTAGGPVITDNGFGPYDGIEDTYLGVVNHTGGTIGFLDLTGPGIFGFDGDGICNYNAGANCSGTNPFGLNAGYAGGGQGLVDTYFSNILNNNTGRVNFAGGLAPGAQAIFTLEEPISTANFQVTTVGGVPEPATWAMMLLGFFGLGATLRRRREVLA